MQKDLDPATLQRRRLCCSFMGSFGPFISKKEMAHLNFITELRVI